MKAPHIYRLRTTLQGIEPAVWRRLEVPGSSTLRQLHLVLQEAFGWWDSHLHEFQLADATYGMSEVEVEDAPEVVRDDRRIRLQDALDVGAQTRYLYDFGDSWEVRILVEAVTPLDPLSRYPRCTAGARAAPPEDCGGIGGYEELLAALQPRKPVPADEDDDESDSEDDNRRRWIGGFYDPEGFDANAVNRRLHGPVSPRYRWPKLPGEKR